MMKNDGPYKTKTNLRAPYTWKSYIQVLSPVLRTHHNSHILSYLSTSSMKLPNRFSLTF